MTDWLAASKLTASWTGHTEPATHAVHPADSFSNARSLCGQTELVVHTEGPDPVGFDPASAYSCKRCVRRLASAEQRAADSDDRE